MKHIIRRNVTAVSLLGVLLTQSPTAQAQPVVHSTAPSVKLHTVPQCSSSGKWSVAGRVSVSPGEVVIYRQQVRVGSRLCSLYYNYSGKSQKMRLRVIAQPRPGSGSLTRNIGGDSGMYRFYAGPVVATFQRGVTVRAFGYPDRRKAQWNFIDVIA